MGFLVFSFKCSFLSAGSLSFLLSHHWVFPPFQRSFPAVFVFYSLWLGLARGLPRTVTETSVQCGKQAWMEVVNKTRGRPCTDYSECRSLPLDATVQMKYSNALATIMPATGCSFMVTSHSVIGFDMNLQAIGLLWSPCSQTSLLVIICICSRSQHQHHHLSSTSDHQALTRFSYGVCNLGPSHAQFTVGLALLLESNAPTDLTGGGAQAVMRAMGSSWKYR